MALSDQQKDWLRREGGRARRSIAWHLLFAIIGLPGAGDHIADQVQPPDADVFGGDPEPYHAHSPEDPGFGANGNGGRYDSAFVLDGTGERLVIGGDGNMYAPSDPGHTYTENSPEIRRA